MHTFGAELTGYARTLPRTRLLRLLRTYREGTEFRVEQARRAHLMTELRKARLTGIRVTVPVEALEGRLSGLPAGVVVERDRISSLGTFIRIDRKESTRHRQQRLTGTIA